MTQIQLNTHLTPHNETKQIVIAIIKINHTLSTENQHNNEIILKQHKWLS